MNRKKIRGKKAKKEGRGKGKKNWKKFENIWKKRVIEIGLTKERKKERKKESHGLMKKEERKW